MDANARIESFPRDGTPTHPAPVGAIRTAENFPVLSLLVPRDRRADFGAVYAFCRAADDLADAPGADSGATLARLEAWRQGLRARVGAGGAPAMRAGIDAPRLDERESGVLEGVARTIRDRDLTLEPFERLLEAFEQDQLVREHASWDGLMAYSSRSASPVGRVVLALLGYREGHGATPALLASSDAVCAGLQLANFWQDVRRDALDLGRVYLPREEAGLSLATLHEWAGRETPRAREAFARALAPVVDRTRALLSRGRDLEARLDPVAAAIVHAFWRAGVLVLDRIERGGHATLWRRPRVGRLARGRLVVEALVRRAARRGPR